MTNKYVLPSEFHLWLGPMYSGKTREMLTQVLKFDDYNICKDDAHKINYLCFKPEIEKTDGPFIVSRGHQGQNEIKKSAFLIPNKRPNEMLQVYDSQLVNTPSIDVIVIDEPQFFSKEIADVISQFQHKDKMVLAAGLLFDYAHDYFGSMPELLKLATEIHTCSATCYHNNCALPATYTQRIMKETGLPAPRGDIEIIAEKDKECAKKNVSSFGYLPACFKHYIHPDKVL